MTTDPVEELANVLKSFPRLHFRYTNHRGVTEFRTVISPTIFWGVSGFYKSQQWLLNAFCLDRLAWRTFAMSAVRNIGPEQE